MTNLSPGSGFERHVVLVAPDVHWNTGNIGRTCIGADAVLHLIKPLGFSLDDKQVKRAGLDYWPLVTLFVWENFEEFIASCRPGPGEVIIFSKSGRHPHWSMPRPQRLFLVFGSETRGLPGGILKAYGDVSYRIPITDNIRSLNLSTAAGIALYESLRPV